MSDSTKEPNGHSGVIGESVPASLRERDQWVVMDGKSPVNPRTDWNNPNKQLSYDEALALAIEGNYELAFALHAEDPFVVLDFDGVGSPDDLPPSIGVWVEMLDTYTEVSRSGTGLHVICRGTRLPDRKQTGNLGELGSVDVFDSNHLVIITGNQTSSNPEIEEGGKALRSFQRTYLPKHTGKTVRPGKDRPPETHIDLESLSTSSLSLTPIDIERTIREYARDGSREAQRARRLWQSSAGSDEGYQSPSEADLALCSDLAFWCQEDARLMDRCFRRSNRHRAKWDEKHYTDGRTYGEGTIQTAIRTNYETYAVERYVIWD